MLENFFSWILPGEMSNSFSLYVKGRFLNFSIGFVCAYNSIITHFNAKDFPSKITQHSCVLRGNQGGHQSFMLK